MADLRSRVEYFTPFEQTFKITVPRLPLGFSISPDNRMLYVFQPAPGPGATVIEGQRANAVTQASFTLSSVDLTTGATRSILEASDRGSPRSADISPDKRQIVMAVNKPGGNTVPLIRLDIASGAIVEVAPNIDPRVLRWSDDGRSIYTLQRGGTTSRLVRIPGEGRTAPDTGLAVPADRPQGATLHSPTLVYALESAVHELWTIKNLYSR